MLFSHCFLCVYNEHQSDLTWMMWWDFIAGLLWEVALYWTCVFVFCSFLIYVSQHDLRVLTDVRMFQNSLNVLAGIHTNTHTDDVNTHSLGTMWYYYKAKCESILQMAHLEPRPPQWLWDEIACMKLMCQHVLIEHNHLGLLRLM